MALAVGVHHTPRSHKSRLLQEVIVPASPSTPETYYLLGGVDYAPLGFDFFRSGIVSGGSRFHRRRACRRGNRQNSFLCIHNSICAVAVEPRRTATIESEIQRKRFAHRAKHHHVDPWEET